MMFKYFVLLAGLFIVIMNFAMLLDRRFINTFLSLVLHSTLASLGGVLIAASLMENFQ